MSEDECFNENSDDDMDYSKYDSSQKGNSFSCDFDIMKLYNNTMKDMNESLSGKGTPVAFFPRVHNHGNISIIHNDTITNISLDEVPNNSKSIIYLTSYRGSDTWKKDLNKNDIDKFVKLSTCDKTCPNSGIFCKKELEFLINRLKSAKNKECPFCKSNFILFSEKKSPPYGTLKVSSGRRFFKLDFNMSSGSLSGRHYGSRTQTAWVPKLQGIHNAKYSDLALWLMIQAWNNGNLFTIGNSVTHGKFGIVFGSVHMKTKTSGGINNHGYGRDPMKDLREKVLYNLISECNSVGIYTPEQLNDFYKDDPKSIKQQVDKYWFNYNYK